LRDDELNGLAWRRGVFQNAVGIRRWSEPVVSSKKRGTREKKKKGGAVLGNSTE
jgi:hypothetical protein